jgi:hypothetical protein
MTTSRCPDKRPLSRFGFGRALLTSPFLKAESFETPIDARRRDILCPAQGKAGGMNPSREAALKAHRPPYCIAAKRLRDAERQINPALARSSFPPRTGRAAGVPTHQRLLEPSLLLGTA